MRPHSLTRARLVQALEPPAIELASEALILLAHEVLGDHIGDEPVPVDDLPRAAVGLRAGEARNG